MAKCAVCNGPIDRNAAGVSVEEWCVWHTYHDKKERVMNKITIKRSSKEITSWTKKITFEREGETYVATLFWDTHEGYDLVFSNPSLFKPTWAVTEYEWANTLEELLDELTD